MCYLFIVVELSMAEQSQCQQQGTHDLQQHTHTHILIDSADPLKMTVLTLHVSCYRLNICVNPTEVLQSMFLL